MKKHRKLKLFFAVCIFLCILFTHSNLWGQIKERNMNLSTNFECKDPEFQFRLNGRLFNHRDQAFICFTTLPDTIEILDLAGNPIPHLVEWTSINPVMGNTQSAVIEENTISSGSETIVAEFEDSNSQNVRLKLKLKVPSFDMYNNSSSIFAYDENNEPNYPTFNTLPQPSIPWKFLEASTIESMKVQSTPDESFYAIDMISSASSGQLTIQPNQMNNALMNTNLQITSLGLLDTLPVDVVGCGEIPELKVLVGNPIHKTVNFVYVCDSIRGCPPNINVSSLLLEANEVLNQVGLYMTVSDVLRDTLQGFNLNGILGEPEQKYLHDLYSNTSFFSSDYLVLITDDLGESDNAPIRGRATLAPATNSLAVDAFDISSGSTIAHEIGHAAFNMPHPRDRVPFVNDNKNFMYYTETGRINNIRAYQFKLIHKIR